MKSLIKPYTIAIILIINYNVFSQDPYKVVRNNSRDSLQEATYLLISNTEKIYVKGSPYISDDFLPIEIKGYKNVVFSGRFNAYNGQMEVKTDDKIIHLDNKEYHQVTFTTLNKIYRTCSYVTKEGKQKRGFLQVIDHKESFMLLKEETINFYKKIPNRSGYESEKPAEFKKENDKFYLYLKDDNTVTFMPTKKKDLLKSFPKRSKRLKNYIKNNKLNTEEETDLIKIAEYISSL